MSGSSHFSYVITFLDPGCQDSSPAEEELKLPPLQPSLTPPIFRARQKRPVSLVESDSTETDG